MNAHVALSAYTPIAERFWPKVDRRTPSECWFWTGSRSTHGYGAFNIHGRPVAAHRVAYELANGPIPVVMFVCHACDNPLCVNPAHLWLGLQSDNMRDMKEKGRNFFASKTHCKHGHAFTSENIYRKPGSTHRHCRKCISRRTTEFRRRKAAQGRAS